MRSGIAGIVVACGVAAILVGVSACKASRWKKNEPESGTVVGSSATPRRVVAPGSADATPATTTIVTFDVDERTGRPKSTLVLRLDYFPEPRPGVANLPTCYDSYANDLEIGVIACVGKPEMAQLTLLAKNVEQDCYTDPKSQRIAASEPLVMVGCRKAQLTTYVYEPELRVDVEVRDVN